jgi:hypothetical protein
VVNTTLSCCRSNVFVFLVSRFLSHSPQIHQTEFQAGMTYIYYSKSSKLDVRPAEVRPLFLSKRRPHLKTCKSFRKNKNMFYTFSSILLYKFCYLWNLYFSHNLFVLLYCPKSMSQSLMKQALRTSTDSKDIIMNAELER